MIKPEKFSKFTLKTLKICFAGQWGFFKIFEDRVDFRLIPLIYPCYKA